MMRVTSAAAILILLVLPAVPAQDRSFELALVHVVNDTAVATTQLSVSPSEIRGKGVAQPKDGSPETELMALLQRDAAGGFVRYDRDLKSKRDGMVLSAVSVVAEESTLAFRERGPVGSRTKSVTGPPIDFVVDAAFPEIFIPFLLDGSRKSVRVLMLPDLEIKTVVLEDRGDRGRYAAVPGGGVTLLWDSAGAFAKLALPGAEARVIVPAGSAASRPAPPRGHESRVVLDAGGEVRIGFTLALPSEGSPPYPAVVLVGDAGVRDRNGVGGGSVVPTLRLLADALAARGIATVRADKRGAGESKGPEPGLAALVEDARSLLEVVALHPSIDRNRLFLAGHGEGALVVSELARASRDKVAGIITLASPARPLPEALEAKLRVRLAGAGQLPEAIEGAVAALRAEMEALRQLPESSPVTGQALLRDLVRIDPAALVAALQTPVLIIHAGDDRETPASQVALMRASLAFSADRARFEMVDGADHDLLESGKTSEMTGTPPSSADVARDVHPRIPALIREFIDRPPQSRPAPR